ncbi:MAG: hypothetical protein LRY50_01790, partial [Geovibrio sp.]|nr:hypothetical protein [Geovibrio sp.]
VRYILVSSVIPIPSWLSLNCPGETCCVQLSGVFEAPFSNACAFIAEIDNKKTKENAHNRQIAHTSSRNLNKFNTLK